jgi:high-affinity iron transporter
MLATLIIVFREVIEAGLIIGIVMAATKGVAGRGRWVGYGVSAGLTGAVVLAGFAGRLSEMFEGSGQELFNAAVLLFAVVMLTWHNVWMASHGRTMARDLSAMGAAVVAGRRSLFALAMVVGIAVLREGSEVVLFLYGIAMAGGASTVLMLIGGLCGVIAGAVLTFLMYYGLLRVPAGRLFTVTAGLITLLAAGLGAQAIAFLQQSGHLRVLTRPLWDSSAILSEHSIVGRLLHTLIGYMDRPNGAELIVYLLIIACMIGLMRLIRLRDVLRRKRGIAAPAR